MGSFLGYAKVPFIIPSYVKAWSYAKLMGIPSDPTNTRRDWRRADAAATSSTSEEVAGLKTYDDGNFTLDGKFYPLKVFLPEKNYLGKLSKVFGSACREKNIGLSLKPDEKNKNWREKKNDHRNLKASVTNNDANSDEADDSKTVFSDHWFTVAAATVWVQLHSTLAKSAIPYDPTSEGIFNTAGVWMQVLASVTTSNTENVTLEIPKYQVAILKKMVLLLFIKAATPIWWILWCSHVALPLIMEFLNLQYMGILMYLTSYIHPWNHPTIRKRYPQENFRPHLVIRGLEECRWHQWYLQVKWEFRHGGEIQVENGPVTNLECCDI